MSSAEAILNKCLSKVAKCFKKDFDSVKKIPLNKRRDYHDDISIGIIDLSQMDHPI